MKAKNFLNHTLTMESKNFNGYTVYEDGSIKSNGLRKVFLKGYDVGKGYDSVKINGVP